MTESNARKFSALSPGRIIGRSSLAPSESMALRPDSWPGMLNMCWNAEESRARRNRWTYSAAKASWRKKPALFLHEMETECTGMSRDGFSHLE